MPVDQQYNARFLSAQKRANSHFAIQTSAEGAKMARRASADDGVDDQLSFAKRQNALAQMDGADSQGGYPFAGTLEENRPYCVWKYYHNRILF